MVLPEADARRLWATLKQDEIFAGYMAAERIERPADFNHDLHHENQLRRAPIRSMLLHDEAEMYIPVALAALQGLKDGTSLRKGTTSKATPSSETMTSEATPRQTCHKCGQEWWVEPVHVFSDRKNAFVPTMEMTVATPRKGAVSAPWPVVSDGANGVKLHVECCPSRFPAPLTHEPTSSEGTSQQPRQQSKAQPKASAATGPPKAAEHCPLCGHKYMQKQGGGHSDHYRKHVLRGQGCQCLARNFMTVRPLRVARETDEQKRAREAFASAVKRDAFCMCAECKPVFQPYIERIKELG